MQSKHCPSRQEIQAYLLGRLELETSEILLRHLQECEVCEQTIVNLESEPDTLVELIKKDPRDANSNGEAPTSELRADSPTGCFQTATPLSVPKDFGQYELFSLLGFGGMGAVYLASRIANGLEQNSRGNTQSELGKQDRSVLGVCSVGHLNKLTVSTLRIKLLGTFAGINQVVPAARLRWTVSRLCLDFCTHSIIGVVPDVGQWPRRANTVMSQSKTLSGPQLRNGRNYSWQRIPFELFQRDFAVPILISFA